MGLELLLLIPLVVLLLCQIPSAQVRNQVDYLNENTKQGAGCGLTMLRDLLFILGGVVFFLVLVGTSLIYNAAK